MRARTPDPGPGTQCKESNSNKRVEITIELVPHDITTTKDTPP